MYSAREKLFGALFYACSSILLMMVNKYLLSVWNFPSSNFVALSQFVSTLICLRGAKEMKWIDFPDLDYDSIREVFPLPIIFLGNAMCGLAGTQAISIPMFGVLRRLTMLFTMVLEFFLLGYSFSTKVSLCVFIMLLGSFLAAYDDLAFDAYGYVVVLMNNLFTSLNGVVAKQKLNKTAEDENIRQRHNSKISDSESDEEEKLKTPHASTGTQTLQKPAPSKLKGLGTWGLMFYNSLFAFPLLGLYLLTFGSADLDKVYNYPLWFDPAFLILFICSSFMGSVLQFSTFYCTKVSMGN